LITAAHCIQEIETNNIKLFVGEHDLNVTGDGEQLVRVQQIIQVLYFNEFNFKWLAMIEQFHDKKFKQNKKL
jgi:hypothetical protein